MREDPLPQSKQQLKTTDRTKPNKTKEESVVNIKRRLIVNNFIYIYIPSLLLPSKLCTGFTIIIIVTLPPHLYP